MGAYVLINVWPGKFRDVMTTLTHMAGVRHADPCWGLPDIFAYTDTPDEKTLNLLVMNKIQSLEGMERTQTQIVVE